MQPQQRHNQVPSARPLERRRHARVKVALLGRYMLSNRQEYPCQTIDMSPGGVSLIAPMRGEIGERVIVYLEHIGRIEGEIVRHIENGFAMTIAAPLRKRDKLANQLTWLANRHALGLPEDRRHERIVPRKAIALLRLPDGSEHAVRIIDVSLSGAALSSTLRPTIGTAVVVGRTPAKVVRRFEGGIAVEFQTPLTDDEFSEAIEL
ncbi:PilZ domain-containing protein [Chelatococcus sp. SYSU_G07232]|uniref:PilZ domain-containing protein n=1 Tax=Chelatococcus albus TaxID=3047466 RepID=A0ABT7AJ41_9HYPH|nr:PilZ domain-containing protein [Chelatococcus sp. SYSU_G07232]MDJ1159392.1 PilZ domain-containing protein [Chelatococcus sp. SYSU_G07232]